MIVRLIPCDLVSALRFEFLLSESVFQVIQGASDMGARLSETELQKSLDFCVKLFNPTSPEEHERLARSGYISNELLDVSSPLVDPSVYTGHHSQGDDNDNKSDCEKSFETQMVLDKINARRVVHAEYAINNFELEPLEEYVVRLERGKLGLVRVS
jgi:hypothetical protein